MIVRALIAATLIITRSLGVAAAPLCDVAIAEDAFVTAVGDGRSFDLEDGRHVRLAAIRAPVFAQNGEGKDEPLAEEARSRLSALILGRSVGLAYADRVVDRHGFMIAHVYRDPQTWLQQMLVAEGLARV